jgi:hypothetical protein
MDKKINKERRNSNNYNYLEETPVSAHGSSTKKPLPVLESQHSKVTFAVPQRRNRHFTVSP